MTRDLLATLPFMETDVHMSNTAQHPTTCSPDLDHVASRLFHELVSADYPDVQIDTATARLVCQNRIERESNMTRSYSLVSSLIDHFTGALGWPDYEEISIHPAPPNEPDRPTDALLEHRQVADLYTQFRNRFAVACKRAMQDEWDTIPPTGKSRRSEFIAHRAAALKLEGQVRLEQGEISSYAFTMLESMLRCEADQTSTQPQRHGVYSLSLVVDERPPVTLSDAFVLVSRRSETPPGSEDAPLGCVLCFLPGSGIEAHESLGTLTDQLIPRILDPELRQQMLSPFDLKNLQQQGLDANPGTRTPTLQCELTPLERRFLGQQFSQWVARQQAEFDQCVWRARAMGLNYEAFNRLQVNALRACAPVDHHQALLRNDARIVHGQMPTWWQLMDHPHRRRWLRHATTFARKIIELQTLTEEYFKGVEFTSDAFIKRHIQTTLEHALAERNIPRAVHDISVSVTHGMPLSMSPVLPTAIHVPTGTTHMSLTDYFYQLLTQTRRTRSIRIELIDPQGAFIEGMDDGFLSQLTARIEDVKAWNDYLDHHLKTSAYAVRLRQLQNEMMRAQMHMGLLEIKQQRFSAKGLLWIKTVLEGPDPATRLPVDTQHIAVRCLEINQKKLPNVLVLAPAENFEKGPMVLCTLGAPDNVVFRWYDNLLQLNVGFVENREFQPYLATQLAVSRRSQAWGMLEYNAFLRHWRMPAVVEYLPTPLPIAQFVFNPVKLAVQHANLFDGCCDIRIEQLIDDIHARLAAARAANQATDAFDFIANIALWFLPTPIMIPLALGIGLCKAWTGFEKVDEGDTTGATQEFLSALGYLGGAAVAELSAAAQESTVTARQAVRPHLVRRIGRDAQQQIGYLLSPAGAPHWPAPTTVTEWNAERFTAVHIEGESGPGYVERRLNLFGRSRLFRRAPEDENLLIHEEDYVLRSKDSTWKIVSSRRVGLSPVSERQASEELSRLLLGWPTSIATVTGAERSIFEAQYVALCEASNTEFFGEVLNYVEGGSGEVNAWLRVGASNLKTRRLLNQFYQLTDWTGVAFRATHVSNACWPMLQRNLGAVFVDRGLQSASMSRVNAQQWSQEMFVSQHGSADNKPVFFIFAPSVHKKNMYCEFLGDHVCVPPDTPLQLQALKLHEDRLFVYFGAPGHAPREMFDAYTGERYVEGALSAG